MNAPPLIDDFQPLSLLRPASVAELGEIVRRAAAEGHALYPIGGGTMLHLGNPPTKPGHAVDLRGLDQVIDYPARDMTITVQAGITIAKLQEVLAAEGQRLPIDVPRPEAATLGGAIAVNASGPRRYGLGTLRDYVIGISFTDDLGNEVKAGGRVVKNVAGYDLCKLQIGALGTLGIVTQVTLKVMPRPEEIGVVKIACQISELSDLLHRVHSSQTRPVAVDVRSRNDGPTLVVAFEGSREAVAWQVERLRQELTGPAQVEVLTGNEAAAQIEWSEVVAAVANRATRMALKAALPPVALPEFLAELTRDDDCWWQAQAGNGIVTIYYREANLDTAGGLITQLRRRAGQGSVIVTCCPPEWKRKLNVWGEPRGDWPLMGKVKRELDPHALFNPGRFVTA